MKQPIVLIGASGLAREVAAAVDAAGTHEIVGVLDDNNELLGTECAGVPVIGSIESASDLGDVQFLICAGAGAARRRIASRLRASGIGSARYATVVHPTAILPPSCLIGAGTVLLAYVTLTADVTVGEHVVVMPQVVLTHDALLFDFVTLCAGVVVGGNVLIESGAYLGMNSSVRQRVRVGQDSTLGMGAALLQDLPPGEVWAGVPAAALAAQSAIPVNRSQSFELIQEPTERLERR